MTKELTIESAAEVSPQISSSKSGVIKQEQGEILADHEHLTYQRSANARRVGLSKREIMEELSRERFPWDE
jgi:hypothetical protein